MKLGGVGWDLVVNVFCWLSLGFAGGRTPGAALGDYPWSSQLVIFVTCSRAGLRAWEGAASPLPSQVSEVPRI